MTRLHVCWTPPSPPPPAEDAVLSFLPAAEEERFALAFKGKFVRAREASADARRRARELYLDLSAAIGASRGASGRTLREACGGEADSASPWWWHPSSFKDCEADPAFGLIIAVFAILEIRAALGAPSLHFVGAPKELVDVFSGGPSRRRLWRTSLRAAASRLLMMARILRERAAASRPPLERAAPGGVLISSFWDWSVTPRPGGDLGDRYAKALPEELARRNLNPIWLCWLDPRGDPSKRERPWREVLAPLEGRNDVVLLQARLSIGDVLRAHADLRPLLAYLRRRAEPDFTAMFRREGLDFFPLFGERLLRGFIDGCLPRCALVALAAERAARELVPSATVSFLEHNPYARAWNDGGRRGARRAVRPPFQHASLCLEKTFYFMDPAREFRGEPDGRPAPCPDLVFAMGSQGREHFLSCGYPPARVRETGNPRYDALRPREARTKDHAGTRLLVAASLDTSVEIDMVEAAAAAALGLPGVEIVVRDHPFSRVEEHPRFAAIADRVRISTCALEQDLAEADAVLFTYSTVAEEAALQGKTVWQWRPISYDASALAEVAPIPRFASVTALRAALASFRPAPLSAGRREEITRSLFHRLDGGAAGRIADEISAAIAPPSSKC